MANDPTRQSPAAADVEGIGSGSLDQIREILFGAAQEQQDDRAGSIEKQLKRVGKEAAGQLDEVRGSLQAQLAAATAVLTADFGKLATALDEASAAATRDRAALDDALPVKVGDLERSLREEIAALTKTTLQQRNDLRLALSSLPRAKDLAESANRAKSTFLANISHELRTPLNVIIGNAEILRDAAESEMPAEELRAFADDILDSGTYLLDHINDLLDIAKAEAGGMELGDDTFEVAPVVDSVLALVRPLPGAGSLTLRTDIPPDLPCFQGDQRRLHQALLNLVSNAVKFTPAGGTVTVRVFDDDDALVIEIADTGIGIAPEDHDRVLEPFVQVHGPVDHRSRAGTGLGLPLAKTLTELHDGTLTLKSTIDQGTTVTLTFSRIRARTAL